MSLDLIIRGGRVVTDEREFHADVGIRDGRIAVLGNDLGSAREEIDATGLLVLPGGIDSHVHLAQDGAAGVVMGDDFDSGTRAALFGGTTTVMPFCLQKRGQTLREALADYQARAAGKTHCDVAFHLIVSDPSVAGFGQDLPALIEAGYRSLKVFMTYEDLALPDYDILTVLEIARDHGALVMVHAEGLDTIRFLNDRLERAGHTAPWYHAASRPMAVEREATHRALALAELVGGRVMVVHVSNGEAMDEIARARARGIGVDVHAETCPQYLILTADDLRGEGMEGAKFVCSPPPRDKAAQADCWRGITSGLFDVVSSDHCPYRFDETGKLTPEAHRGYRWIPNGIPGIETRLPILFSEGVGKGRINLCRFVALSATNHARIHGLYPQKGTIAVGADADLALWDPSVERTIAQADLHHGCDYTPYEGLAVRGWPVTVLLRGQVMVHDGAFVGPAATGHLMLRDGSAPYVSSLSQPI